MFDSGVKSFLELYLSKALLLMEKLLLSKVESVARKHHKKSLKSSNKFFMKYNF